MRFDISVSTSFLGYSKVLKVVLFSKSDEEHAKDEYNSGIYDCCATVPDDKSAFLSMIEDCVNLCLRTYEESLSEKNETQM